MDNIWLFLIFKFCFQKIHEVLPLPQLLVTDCVPVRLPLRSSSSLSGKRYLTSPRCTPLHRNQQVNVKTKNSLKIPETFGRRSKEPTRNL